MYEAEDALARPAGECCAGLRGEEVLHADLGGAGASTYQLERCRRNIVGGVVLEVEMLDSFLVGEAYNSAIVGVNSGQMTVAQDGIAFPGAFLICELGGAVRRGKYSEHKCKAAAGNPGQHWLNHLWR